MDVRIYDPPEAGSPTFQNVGRVTACTRQVLVDRWTEPGYFTLEVPREARHAEELQDGRLISVGKFWGILDGDSFSWDSGGDILTVKGRQLKGLTGDRITIPPAFNAVMGAQGYDTAAGSTEACMKHYVNVNMGPGAAPDRRVFGMVILADEGRGLANDKYISRHDGLDKVLSALGAAGALGYDIIPDLTQHTLVFDVNAGEDHTAGQSQRKRVIFDIERKTAISQQYDHSNEDARNLFYATMAGSEFADEALTATYTREGEAIPVGIRRREQHLSVSVSTPVAGSEYDELRRQVLAEAEKYRPSESFTCRVAAGPYVYGEDYRVGDLVTVRNRAWGVQMDTHLTEMRTEWSDSGLSLTATFGTAPLNVFGRLQRQIQGRK